MNDIIVWVQNNWLNIVTIYTSMVTVASVIVKFTPTLKDDTILLNITKFVAKFIALNTSTPKAEERPK